MGPSGAVLREELLRRDNVDKRKRKKAYPPAGTSLQGFAHRFNYSCKSVPVRKSLQVLAKAPPFRQRDDLCGQFHVVCPGRYTCGSVSVSLYL